MWLEESEEAQAQSAAFRPNQSPEYNAERLAEMVWSRATRLKGWGREAHLLLGAEERTYTNARMDPLSASGDGEGSVVPSKVIRVKKIRGSRKTIAYESIYRKDYSRSKRRSLEVTSPFY